MLLRDQREVRVPMLGVIACLVLLPGLPAQTQSSTEQLYREARAAVQHGDLALAEQKYLKLTRRTPQDAKAYHNLGAVYFREIKYQEAAAALEKAVQLNPSLPITQVLLGRAYYELRQNSKAATALEAALRLKPGDPQATLYLGKAQIELGNTQAAVDLLSKLAQTRPADPEVMQALSTAYMKQTMEGMSHQGNLAPQSFESLQMEALEAEARNDAKAAAEYYRQALEIKPKAPGVHYALGEALMKMGNNIEAAREYQKEVELDPKNSRALWKLGYFTLRADPQKAREYLERSVSLEPERAGAVLTYGRALALTGETEQAVAQFLRALQLKPELVTPHYMLATAYRRLGRSEDAKAELARFETLSKVSSVTAQERVRKRLEARDHPQWAAEELESDSPPAHQSSGPSSHP